MGIEHPRFKYFRPQYSDRDRDGLPREWIARMKRAIRTLGWRFSADRMVIDDALKAYIPAAGGTSSDVCSSVTVTPLRCGRENRS